MLLQEEAVRGSANSDSTPVAIPEVHQRGEECPVECPPSVNQRGDAAESDKLEGSILMLAVAVLWGSNFPAVKAIMEGGLSPAAAAALRFSFAAIALSPLLRKGPLPRELVLGGFECGCWIALGYIAQALALQDAPASIVAFLASLQVVFVPLVLTAFGQPATQRLLVAALLCVSGVGFLELGASSADAMGGGGASLQAQFLALLQPVGFGTSYLRIEALMRRFPDCSLQLSALQLISNAAVSIAWLAGGTVLAGATVDLGALSDPAVLGGLLWTALVSTALTVLLQTRALSKLPATDSSVIVATEVRMWTGGDTRSLSPTSAHSLLCRGLASASTRSPNPHPPPAPLTSSHTHHMMLASLPSSHPSTFVLTAEPTRA